jgi:hypothetical protein
VTAKRFVGTVQNGEMVFDAPARFAEQIKALEGKRVVLSIDKHRPNRSLKANAYYWSCVIPHLAEELGYDHQEMHDALKQRFLSVHTNGPLPTVKSTSKLDSREFADYVDNCIRLAGEMGVVIPIPSSYAEEPKRGRAE